MALEEISLGQARYGMRQVTAQDFGATFVHGRTMRGPQDVIAIALADRPDRPRSLLRAALRRILLWAQRSAERRCLAALSDAALKDMGISRYDALYETRKPFWRE
jgi:uncharacterized protein YjiS (DUF1127 family)